MRSIEPVSVKWASTSAAPTRSATVRSKVSAVVGREEIGGEVEEEGHAGPGGSIGTKLVSATSRAQARASRSAVGTWAGSGAGSSGNRPSAAAASAIAAQSLRAMPASTG